MDDLISRQAAIDATAYSTISVTISGKRGFQNYKEEFEKACVAIRDKYIEALKDLPSAQPETQWIPCSERLPEDGDYVIVTVWEGSVMIAWRDHNEWETESFSLDDGEVNAWMPLPGPWKGEDK